MSVFKNLSRILNTCVNVLSPLLEPKLPTIAALRVTQRYDSQCALLFYEIKETRYFFLFAANYAILYI